MAGAAHVLSGPLVGTTSLADSDAKLIGELSRDFSGVTMAAGDINGDGLSDIVVGAFGQDGGGDNAGAAHVVHGPVTGDVDLGQADAKILGSNVGDNLGHRVATGDFNGDADRNGRRRHVLGARLSVGARRWPRERPRPQWRRLR